MTNAEKYLKHGASVEEFARELCSELPVGDVMPRNIIEALNKPIALTLTEDERVILKNINKKFNRIQRNIFGSLILTENGCEKIGEAMHTLYAFNHLFQFIKERRRILNTRIVRR